jgi:hypothetical protein
MMVLAVLAVLAAAAAAEARTLYVANNGVDNAVCGPRNPCRSISRTIAIAVARDTILVGPGVYGDLNGNGILGEPGEETGFPNCSCMIWMDRAVTLISQDGAATTTIDARRLNLDKNVYMVGGGELGRPGQGFTVTQPGKTLASNVAALTVETFDAKVRGNQIVSDHIDGFVNGIRVLNLGGTILVEGNEVRGWGQNGIFVRGSGTTVRRNVLAVNSTGIWAEGANTLQNNVIASNVRGVRLHDETAVIGNALYGNHDGIQVDPSFTGSIEGNNIFGSRFCGLVNKPGIPFLIAAHNYWGAPSGPGLDPADTVCNAVGAATQVTPFATRPFVLLAPIKP